MKNVVKNVSIHFDTKNRSILTFYMLVHRSNLINTSR